MYLDMSCAEFMALCLCLVGVGYELRLFKELEESDEDQCDEM